MNPPTTGEGTGRACIGLGMVGQGLAMVSGVVPHEEPWVAYGLLVFGAVLLATGALPSFPRARRGPMLLVALGMLGTVAVAWRLTGRPPTGPLALLAALGAATMLAAALHGKVLKIQGRAVAVRDAAWCGAVAIGVPVLVWVVQATFKRFSGTTPLEAFDAAFLVRPTHGVLATLGLAPATDGRLLTVPGPSGPLMVEIGVACSGLQAMALFLGVLGLFVVAERPSNGRLLAWTTIGLLGVYVSNVARLVVVVLAGHHWGADALVAVHANAGWAFFLAWTLVFALYVRWDLAKASGRGA